MLRKICIIVLFLLSVICAKADELTFRIKGALIGNTNYQYAYLYQSDTKKLLRVKLENRRFEFTGEIILYKKDFNVGFIFLSNDSAAKFINQREIIEKQIDRQYRMIILGRHTINVTTDADIKNAKVEGCELNKDYDEMNLAGHELKYEQFIDSHRDSPISLLLIRGILPLKHLPIFDQLNFQGLYDKLSNKIKQSEYGLETLKRIKNL
ncbi:DUF4369 domain-containing protein [Pedobacter sp. SL55]|uniref:DUF4369 domain-containing protein n=1 Tax=Pedobacter sp. SL55 TaxID=2995161 RepID=UPI002271030A|nr:DUF4369 domain-containing protein [Pedobacter sp. SL55]WAC41435.1 DUF4369 domain-containing protein [Pedobacter sp. SL55]